MTDRYVDNGGADGDGSIGSPWNNIAGHVNDLSAGDTMHVRGNDSEPGRVYNETPVDIDGTGSASSGTPGSPITICNYQDEYVIWQCSTSEYYPFALRDVDYWTLDGLKFHAQNKNCNMVLWGGVTHVTMSNCTIYNGARIALNIGTSDDCIVEYCTMYDFETGPGSDAHGIIIGGGANNIFRHNTIYDITGDCIRLYPIYGRTISNTLIEDNHLYTTLGLCSENGIDAGRIPADSEIITGLTIQRNTLHGFRCNDGSCAGTGGGVGEAIAVWEVSVTDDVLIKDNIIYDSTTAIKVNCSLTEITGNLIYDGYDDAISWLSVGIYVMNCSDTEVYNNTLVNMPDHSFYLSDAVRDAVLRNNLCYDCEDITVESGGTYSADYNGWFDCTDTLVGANDTTGSGDPGFVNAAGDDYTLLSTSVCIDEGVDVGIAYNGVAPDLGYIEYEGGAGLVTLGLALGIGFSATVTWASPPPEVLTDIAGAAYKLRFYSPAGVLVAETADFEMLGYTKRVNTPGLLMFNMRGDHGGIALLENRSQIEVWRRNERRGLDWHCDFYGLYLSQARQYAKRNIFTAYCPGQMWLLATRIVAWYTATANRTVFTTTAAETIMKTLVDYNACANATAANGRLRDGAVTGLSIQTDSAAGNTLSWKCAYKNLLVELQNLAMVAGGDFDLIKTAAQAWGFRWYTGQRGADRRSTVIFTHERGNMANPQYSHGRIDEKTVAIVGGQGEEDERDTCIMTGDDYSASNDVEMFVDARTRTSPLGLQDAGNEQLNKTQAREKFTWEVVQTPACFYGQVTSGGDYELGDLVTARAFDIEREHKISGVTITVTPTAKQMEVIDIETETPVTTP